MPDKKYCYPDSEVLKNKLNIRDKDELFEAEKKLTFARLQKLQSEPIKGKFDFAHLKAIHKYIFQDLYDWAGEERTVDIGKGNLFCTVPYIQEYAKSVFNKYHSQCYANRDNFEDYIRVPGIRDSFFPPHNIRNIYIMRIENNTTILILQALTLILI